MDQLIDQIVQRTGISRDQATQAAQTAVAFFKDKLPGPIASQLDNVVGGQMGGQSMGGQSMGGQSMGGMPGQVQQNLGNMGGNLGGMLGGQGNQP